MDLYLDLDNRDNEACPGRGTLNPPFAVVGIAPSPSRPYERRNEPFGSRSLTFIRGLIEATNGEVYITNLRKTPLAIGEKIPKKELTKRWIPLMQKELEIVNPKRLLVFGSQTAKVLCQYFDDLNEDHGVFFPCSLKEGVLAMPTYHPSAVNRNPALKEIFIRDLERFFKLADKIPETEPFNLIDTVEQVRQLQFQTGTVVLDIETPGLEYDGTILMIGVQPSCGTQSLLINPTKEMVRALYAALKKAKVSLIGHNLQFDLHVLMLYSDQYWDLPCLDTYLLAHSQGREMLSLKHLTTVLTDLPGSRAFGDHTNPKYLSGDLTSTTAIFDVMTHESRPWIWENVLSNLIPETTAMRIRGVYLDRPRLLQLDAQFSSEVQERMAGALESLHAPAGFNINSTQQLSTALIKLGVKLPKTEAGNYSVAEAVLLEHKDEPWAVPLLNLRESEKAYEFTQKYVKSTSEGDPFLHPQIHFTAATGRTSMREPNLQQVTRVGPLKLLFRSRWEGGKVGLVDLSQAELRVACLLSEDEVMMYDLTHGDVHRINASTVYRIPQDQVSALQRKKSKGVTFGVLYGGSAKGLATRVGCNVEEVELIMQVIFGKYKKLANYLENQRIEGIANQAISSIFGRTRSLTNLILTEGEGSAARKAVNTPIQGVASDSALCIMNSICISLRRGGFKSRVMFGVHDSILTDVHPEEREAIVPIIQDGFHFLNKTPLAGLSLFKDLPLEGEFILGETWAHVESTNENYSPDSKHPCSSSL